MTQDFLGQLVADLAMAQETELDILSADDVRCIVFRGYTISFVWSPEDQAGCLTIENAPVMDLFTFANTETWRFVFLEKPSAPFDQYVLWGVKSQWGKQHFPRPEQCILEQVLELKKLVLMHTKDK